MDDGQYNPQWSGRRVHRALAYIKTHGAANRTPCVICEQPIDYTLTHPNPWSCTVQHILSQKDFPQYRWQEANWGPAHLECNLSAGAAIPTGLGTLSEDW